MKQEERKAVMQQIAGSLENCQGAINSFRDRIEAMIRKRAEQKAANISIPTKPEQPEKPKTRVHVPSEQKAYVLTLATRLK